MSDVIILYLPPLPTFGLTVSVVTALAGQQILIAHRWDVYDLEEGGGSNTKAGLLSSGLMLTIRTKVV